MCPVPLCKERNPWFESEEEWRAHLEALHQKSVGKNGLEDLLAFAKVHPGEWYLKEWREIDANSPKIEEAVQVG